MTAVIARWTIDGAWITTVLVDVKPTYPYTSKDRMTFETYENEQVTGW
jgi:hypothetical protein